MEHVNEKRYVNTCTKCGRVWKSKLSREDMTAYHHRFCRGCRGMCDIWVRSDPERVEAPDWRERWPRLPRGVQGPVLFSRGGSPRFKAVHKGKYLGLFATVEEALAVVTTAKEAEDGTDSV